MDKIKKDVGANRLDEDALELLENAERKDRDAVIEVLQDCIPGLSLETLRWIEDEVRERKSGKDMCTLFCYYTDVLNDPKKGFALAIEASDYGSDVASYHVGDAYRKGDVLPRNFDEAYKYYARAKNQGCDWFDSPNPLGPADGSDRGESGSDCMIADLSPSEFSLEWWLYVLERNPTPILKCCLAMWFRDPVPNLGWDAEAQPDHFRALKLFEDAAKGGNGKAMSQLAEMYVTKKFYNREKAIEWFRAAEDHGMRMQYLSPKLGIQSELVD